MGRMRRPRFATASGGPQLRASASSFLTSVAQGALIAEISRPYGAGTVFATVGGVPGQLSFDAAAARVSRGVTAPAAGQSYELKVRATSADGRRETAETFVFSAIAPAAPGFGSTMTG